MENTSYIGLSQQVALQRLMDMTAHNMANMTTPGYKSENMLFDTYLSKARSSTEGKIEGVRTAGTYRDLSSGPLSQTSNPLDLAIEGGGYFSVETASGTRYTRNGSFSLNARGELVTKDGDAVLGTNGGPLTIPRGATQISITSTGRVSTERGQVGRLKLVSFEDDNLLTPAGGTLLAANGAQEADAEEDVRIHQGFLEGSNVQPVFEMNKMIEIQRLYTAAQTMIMNEHDMQRSMIDKLTKV